MDDKTRLLWELRPVTSNEAAGSHKELHMWFVLYVKTSDCLEKLYRECSAPFAALDGEAPHLKTGSLSIEVSSPQGLFNPKCFSVTSEKPKDPYFRKHLELVVSKPKLFSSLTPIEVCLNVVDGRSGVEFQKKTGEFHWPFANNINTTINVHGKGTGIQNNIILPQSLESSFESSLGTSDLRLLNDPVFSTPHSSHGRLSSVSLCSSGSSSGFTPGSARNSSGNDSGIFTQSERRQSDSIISSDLDASLNAGSSNVARKSESVPSTPHAAKDKVEKAKKLRNPSGKGGKNAKKPLWKC